MTSRGHDDRQVLGKERRKEYKISEMNGASKVHIKENNTLEEIFSEGVEVIKLRQAGLGQGFSPVNMSYVSTANGGMTPIVITMTHINGCQVG